MSCAGELQRDDARPAAYFFDGRANSAAGSPIGDAGADIHTQPAAQPIARADGHAGPVADRNDDQTD